MLTKCLSNEPCIRVIGTWGLYSILTKNNKFVKKLQDKGKGALGFQGGPTMGKLIE
jgi:hypothetical protein